MKLQFDASLTYQQEAIKAVVDLFKGQPMAQGTHEVTMAVNTSVMAMSRIETSQQKTDDMLEEAITVGNHLALGKSQRLTNLADVQVRNGIKTKSDKLLKLENFSVEMETGTGKTYVYLRTLFELHKRYGFSKFIVVVPSIAVREGVLKSISMLQTHFRTLYDNIPFTHFVYDSGNLNKVKEFATGHQLQIMVMNIQAFNKDTAIMHNDHEKMLGYSPIRWIQAVNPIVIVDEPQSVEGNTSRGTTAGAESLKKLNALFTLRYSATHFNAHNLVYKLGPVEAFDLKLVKQVQVASVRDAPTFNQPYIKLLAVDNSKAIRAYVEINVQKAHGPERKKVWIKFRDDLYKKSSERMEYEQGFQVSEISCEPGGERVVFGNGQTVTLKTALGDYGDAILKAQIYSTVKEHFEKERLLRPQGIKVLSLFFIDKVASYRQYNKRGQPLPGRFVQWFEEAYTQLQNDNRYQRLFDWQAGEVHNGYFSQDKKGKVKDTKGDAKDDGDTYALIMRDKERLLDTNEPLRFIFSHTALKEGWDNPNVFQICTLNETKSLMRKRQEIGRGLRLPVNDQGVRVYDSAMNRLTVIANESYEMFAKQLQHEYTEAYGIDFGKVPDIAFSHLTGHPEHPHTALGQEGSKKLFYHLLSKGYLNDNGETTEAFKPESPDCLNDLLSEYSPLKTQIIHTLEKYTLKNRILKKDKPQPIRLRDDFRLDENFAALWERIAQKTRYHVRFDTEALIQQAADKINAMPPVQKPQIYVDKVNLEHSYAGIEVNAVVEQQTMSMGVPQPLPDIITWLQNATELTRHTLVDILKRSNRLQDFFNNPQVFINQVTDIIQGTLHRMTVRGIQYEKTGQMYEMEQISREAKDGINRYLKQAYRVKKPEKTLYDYVPFDSGVEKTFVEHLENRERVKFYCKLPRWFKVDTPVGTYNPDWAIVVGEEEKLYLVQETKGTTDTDRLRPGEQDKIRCAEKHFDVLDDVSYAVAETVEEAIGRECIN